MTKSKAMHSVAQVLDPEFGRTWHEAVAVVQEVASLLTPGLTVPGPEDLVFNDDGTLSLGFGSESGEPPVVSLAKLLDGLLDGLEAPAALRDLARENSGSSPSHVSVDSFVKALSFYERPGRSNDIRAIHGRLRSKGTYSTPDDEVRRLREKLANLSDEPSARPKDAPSESKKQKNQRTVLVIGTAAAAVVVAVGAWWLTAGVDASAGLDRVEQKIADTMTAGLKKVGMTFDNRSGSSVPVASAAESRVASSPAKGSRQAEAMPRGAVSGTSGEKPRSRNIVLPAPTRHSSSGSGSSSSSNPSSLTRHSVASSVVSSLPPPPPDPPANDPDYVMPAAGPEVYSSADPGVKPPIFIRPQLPREPAPGVDTGYFDIIVNESGDVEQVKLISPTRRYQERMLVAAAKAWKFKPAMVAGRFVKYRMRVPIILTGLP